MCSYQMCSGERGGGRGERGRGEGGREGGREGEREIVCMCVSAADGALT